VALRQRMCVASVKRDLEDFFLHAGIGTMRELSPFPPAGKSA
jgi:hypothetical protein